MKNVILIPTDFTVASLNMLKQALKDNDQIKTTYILVFKMHASDSITDLMFYSKSNLIETHTNEFFNEGLEILKYKYCDFIENIRIEPFFGFTKSAFKSFVKSHQITAMYLPNETLLNMHGDLKQISQYAQKIDIHKTTVNWSIESKPQASNPILQLFNS